MGDSRSYYEDHKDDIKICPYGQEHKYFDDCTCKGCLADRDEMLKLEIMVKTGTVLLRDELKKLHPVMREDYLKKLFPQYEKSE